MYIVAIIVAAGRGSRLGGGVAKQFLPLGGSTVLEHSLDVFDRHVRVDEIVVVLPSDRVADSTALGADRQTPVHVVPGGARRQDSVARGFALVPPHADLVVVHDAARPFVSAALIDRAIDAASETGAAVAAVAARDTVKLVDHVEDRVLVDTTLPRGTIYLAQTPQVFRREVLEAGLALGETMEVTDEAMLVERAGHAVRVVDGDARNVKITTAFDLAAARAVVADSPGVTGMRIGIGYDLHRLVDGRPLVLGGVTIPYARGLLGHSDADAVCHAVVDAILGAAAAGDIGQHFPNSDPQWKDVSSLDLLARARAIVRDRGFEVRNIDVVVIAEQPKLSAYLEAMRSRVAEAAGVSLADVGMKGKTNEGVGPLGRGDAIAVHAVAQLAPVATDGPASGSASS